jgi:hypothetical protein
MSLTNDHSVDGREPHDKSEAVAGQTRDVTSRYGLTREAAMLEMEKFLGVGEYETRKILGQNASLRRPSLSDQAEPTHSKSEEVRVEPSKVEQRETASAIEGAAQKMPGESQPIDSDQQVLAESGQ